MSDTLTYDQLPFQLEDRLYEGDAAAGPGDRRDGAVYAHEHDPGLRMALEVALITGRPLLMRGPPGCGKSTFALAVARRLGWRHYKEVVTSQTEARDLLYQFDAVARLADAQAQRLKPDDDDARYVKPGALWWAFSPESARNFGRLRKGEAQAHDPDLNPDGDNQRKSREKQGMPTDGAVVLIDEIDKAESDLPNDLLEPLGVQMFRVHEIQKDFELKRDVGGKHNLSPVLVIIATNEERDLPQAFLRRCVVHKLSTPPRETLLKIARLHFAHDLPSDELCNAVAEHLHKQAQDSSQRRPASTAEFLDCVRACHRLGIIPPDDNDGKKDKNAPWDYIKRLTLRKGA